MRQWHLDALVLHRKKTPTKLTALSVAALLGEAIKRIHSDESVTSLFNV